MAKSAIMTTAYQDVMKEDGVTAADPFDFGAGHVDLGGKANKGSPFEPGLVYDAGLFEYAAFTCGADLGDLHPGQLRLPGVDRRSDRPERPERALDRHRRHPGQPNRSAHGDQRCKGEWLADLQRLCRRPPGFEVTVSPSSFRLKSGDTATYEVTVTNVSAPVGEWRHGSLTWSDKTGHYDVYSRFRSAALCSVRRRA